VDLLPYTKTDYSQFKSNITFHEILSFTESEFLDWCHLFQKEILNNWSLGMPPSIGKSESDIKEDFRKLTDYEVRDSTLLTLDEKGNSEIIGRVKNFKKVGNSVIQFFPTIMKTKVNGVSIYDSVNSDNLLSVLEKKIRYDSMYLFSSTLKSETEPSDIVKHLEQVVKGFDRHTGMYLFHSKSPISDTFDGYVRIDIGSLLELVKIGILKDQHLSILDEKIILLIKETQASNLIEDEIYFTIRVYDKRTKVFPNIYQVLRLGFGQVAVNFPPLTTKVLVETFLEKIEEPQNEYVVYDPCMGWGGRLLGCMSSQLPIHYVGTEVNSEIWDNYNVLMDFCNGIGMNHSSVDFFRLGSQKIRSDKNFQKYMGDVDLVLTSPPYYNREVYSDDKEQSCHLYDDYYVWRDEFLRPTLTTCFDCLKSDRFLLLNISDLKQGKEYYPLEQDSVSICMNLGFRFHGKILMYMSRMIGLNVKEIKNSHYDSDDKKYFKTEPIMVFSKQGE